MRRARSRSTACVAVDAPHAAHVVVSWTAPQARHCRRSRRALRTASTATGASARCSGALRQQTGTTQDHNWGDEPRVARFRRGLPTPSARSWRLVWSSAKQRDRPTRRGTNKTTGAIGRAPCLASVCPPGETGASASVVASRYPPPSAVATPPESRGVAPAGEAAPAVRTARSSPPRARPNPGVWKYEPIPPANGVVRSDAPDRKYEPGPSKVQGPGGPWEAAQARARWETFAACRRFFSRGRRKCPVISL